MLIPSDNLLTSIANHQISLFLSLSLAPLGNSCKIILSYRGLEEEVTAVPAVTAAALTVLLAPFARGKRLELERLFAVLALDAARRVERQAVIEPNGEQRVHQRFGHVFRVVRRRSHAKHLVAARHCRVVDGRDVDAVQVMQVTRNLLHQLGVTHLEDT